MIAALYFEPLWIFHRGDHPITRINELQGKRIAAGAGGSGTRAFVERMLALNGVTTSDKTLIGHDPEKDLQAVLEGDADVAMLVGGAETPAILKGLHHRGIRLASLARTEAYVRRYGYITRLTLPAGTLDLADGIPENDVAMIGTKAMLVARNDLHPALAALLIDAAREIHSGQGTFEAPGEFPSIAPVDLPVLADAQLYVRNGPTFLHRFLPFWVATFGERVIIVLLPLAAIVYPVATQAPKLIRQRIRSRILRWYRELAVLEHDIRTREDPLPIERWLAELDRISHGAERVNTPPTFAGEAYELREHIALVRESIAVRTRAALPRVVEPSA